MNQKIYIVATQIQDECVGDTLDIYPYIDKETAIERFKREINAAKEGWEYNPNDEESDIIVDEDDVHFSIFKDGDYIMNHITINLYEEELA